MSVRTRFAPSPTGFLHIGGVRTALFSWLYARRHKGQFILRIEDTDKVRSTETSKKAILDGMAWLGLNYDEGPFYQTDRYARYSEVIDTLLANEKAYYCYCSKERLAALREEQLKAKIKPRYDGACLDKAYSKREKDCVVRFNNPKEGEVCFNDLVYGDISVSNNELDDLIIQRSDGNPTYNFTVVVDDMDMGVTDVIRGDDHINNTPRQINLFNALNSVVPRFAHLPMILGEDGKRLSKRHGAVSVLEFKEAGILPDALLNYLVRLGWSHKDKEIFSLEEMINLFSLDAISRGAASFNHEKLLWLNQHYIKNMDEKELAILLLPFYQAKKVLIKEGPPLDKIALLMKERATTLIEMVEKSLYFFNELPSYDEKAMQKQLKPSTLPMLETINTVFNAMEKFEAELLHQTIVDVAERFSVKMGKVAQPIRVAVTGNTASPSMGDTLALIGKQRVLKRLAYAIDYVKNLV